MNPTEQLMTIAEAARMLRLTKRQVLAMVSAGELPYIVLPSSDDPLFDEADLRKYVAAHRVPANGEFTLPAGFANRPSQLPLSLR